MYGKNAWEKHLKAGTVGEVATFCEGYKDFISTGKTERLCVKNALEIAKAAGFKPLEEATSIKPGDRLYSTNRGKNIVCFIIGKQPVVNGINILGAHIDSPRLDIKQNPMYEKYEFALLDTHYYGGVKKYQWLTIPLALHGVICKKDGTSVEFHVGEDPKDPVFEICDLLIHLSQQQLQAPASQFIPGEKLDVTIGSIPGLNEEGKDLVKKNILRYLMETYGVEEEDFLSAEIEVVPAGKARDLGFDRGLIGGYGHDDRVCAYTSLKAICDLDTIPERTSCAVLVDKEEIGSVGNTGAQSAYFPNVIAELLALEGRTSDLDVRRCISRCNMLSSDVSAGVNPIFDEVMELKNSCFLGHGIVFNKYTGSRGKGGCNDAHPEFIAKIRNMLDNNDVNYQTAELGKVDAGGGGTIAYILANLNMNVIDAGVPVLSMHSPMEVVSKVDVYEAYKAYKVFLLNA